MSLFLMSGKTKMERKEVIQSSGLPYSFSDNPMFSGSSSVLFLLFYLIIRRR